MIFVEQKEDGTILGKNNMRYDLIISFENDAVELFEDLVYRDRVNINDTIFVDGIEYKITSKCHFVRKNPCLFGEPV